MKLLTTIVCAAFAALACSGGDITDTEWHAVQGPDASAQATPASLEWVQDEIIDPATGEVMPTGWAPPPLLQNGPDLGQTAEALSFVDGFGSLSGSQNRCTGSHWPAACLVPKHKFINFLHDTDTQTPTSNQSVALGNAVASILAIWKADGYLVTKITNISQCTEPCVRYHFTSLPSGAPAGAVAVTRRQTNSSDVSSVSQGTLQKWSFAEVIVDLNALAAGGGLNGLTSTQQVFLITNVWQHEFGHASGLGHFGDGNQVLMGAVVNDSQSTAIPAVNTHLLPSSQERGFQASFVGDRL